MEHLIITVISAKYVKITGETGYSVRDKISGRIYSEVVCQKKYQGNYEAVQA